MLMYDGVGALQYLINTLCIYVVILNIAFVTVVGWWRTFNLGKRYNVLLVIKLLTSLQYHYITGS